MGGECSKNVKRRGVYRVLVGKSEGMRPLLSPRCRWDNSIQMDIQ